MAPELPISRACASNLAVVAAGVSNCRMSFAPRTFRSVVGCGTRSLSVGMQQPFACAPVKVQELLCTRILFTLIRCGPQWVRA